jgi:hypothetical protein
VARGLEEIEIEAPREWCKNVIPSESLNLETHLFPEHSLIFLGINCRRNIIPKPARCPP